MKNEGRKWKVQGTNFDDIGLHVFAIANCDSVIGWCLCWMDGERFANDCT